MHLSICSESPTREVDDPNANRALLPTQPKPPVANERLAVMNRWLDESATEAPWVQFFVSNSQNNGDWRTKNMRRMLDDSMLDVVDGLNTGATSSKPRSPDNPWNHLSDRISEVNNPPGLSDGSSHNEKDHTAAGVLEVLVRRVTEVLEFDDPTDGQDNVPTNESHSNSSRGGSNTGKAKGKRIASTNDTESNSQDDPQKQISGPKRLKIARSATSAGGRFFACLFLKRDSNYCQKTHCAGRSTCSVETVIRVGRS